MKRENMIRVWPIASGFYNSCSGIDLRTGRHYSDKNVARQTQQREDREVASDMRARQLGLTGRLDRVKELRILTEEFHTNDRRAKSFGSRPAVLLWLVT